MSPVLRNALVRASRQSATTALGYRAASTHAISNPTLANIEKRWEGMPMQEQAELWMALRDRMKENWADMTVQEKKAGKLPMPSPLTASFIHGGSVPQASRSLGRAP
jgi:cytochrome c oxidase subunit 4